MESQRAATEDVHAHQGREAAQQTALLGWSHTFSLCVCFVHVLMVSWSVQWLLPAVQKQLGELTSINCMCSATDWHLLQGVPLTYAL